MNYHNYKPDLLVMEKDIERYLVNVCTELGYLCPKFASPSNRGVPDRIIIAPNIVIFVEVKAPGKKPTKLQSYVHTQYEARGQVVRVVDTFQLVDLLLNQIRKAVNEIPTRRIPKGSHRVDTT